MHRWRRVRFWSVLASFLTLALVLNVWIEMSKGEAPDGSAAIDTAVASFYQALAVASLVVLTVGLVVLGFVAHRKLRRSSETSPPLNPL